MAFDKETNKSHYDMFIKCGQDISKLRGDEDAWKDDDNYCGSPIIVRPD